MSFVVRFSSHLTALFCLLKFALSYRTWYIVYIWILQINFKYLNSCYHFNLSVTFWNSHFKWARYKRWKPEWISQFQVDEICVWVSLLPIACKLNAGLFTRWTGMRFLRTCDAKWSLCILELCLIANRAVFLMGTPAVKCSTCEKKCTPEQNRLKCKSLCYWIVWCRRRLFIVLRNVIRLEIAWYAPEMNKMRY